MDLLRLCHCPLCVVYVIHISNYIWCPLVRRLIKISCYQPLLASFCASINVTRGSAMEWAPHCTFTAQLFSQIFSLYHVNECCTFFCWFSALQFVEHSLVILSRYFGRSVRRSTFAFFGLHGPFYTTAPAQILGLAFLSLPLSTRTQLR